MNSWFEKVCLNEGFLKSPSTAAMPRAETPRVRRRNSALPLQEIENLREQIQEGEVGSLGGDGLML